LSVDENSRKIEVTRLAPGDYLYSSGVDRLPPYPLACITLALVQTPVLAPVQETVRGKRQFGDVLAR